VALDPGNFSAHEELARLAEQRDELELAAEHFEAAWRLRPDRRDLLLDLGRVWKEMGRDGDSIAALIAAWRGASARVSEQARVLKLGWAYNIVKDDQEALRWFDRARRSPDPAVSTQALRAYRNLAPGLERFRTTLWAYPIYSTRWHDAFGYAQIKTEARLAFLPLRPYVSLRLGDFRGSVQTAFGPQFLSDRSAIAAAGLATIPWYGLTGWLEAGEALFFRRTPQDRARMKPDYRGGVSYGKGLRPSARLRLAWPFRGEQYRRRLRQPLLQRLAPLFAEPLWLHAAKYRRVRRVSFASAVERESHRRRTAAVLGELRRIRPGLSLPLRFAARVADGFHKLLTRSLSDERWQSAPAELQRAASKRLVCDCSFSALFAAAVACPTATFPYRVIGPDPGPWPAILSSLGLAAGPVESARVVVAPAGAGVAPVDPKAF